MVMPLLEELDWNAFAMGDAGGCRARDLAGLSGGQADRKTPPRTTYQRADQSPGPPHPTAEVAAILTRRLGARDNLGAPSPRARTR